MRPGRVDDLHNSPPSRRQWTAQRERIAMTFMVQIGSHRMKRLCFRALAERLISESKAAEILGISLRDLTRRMDQPSMA